jgi:formylglycine-generating enzyme required for sulfatase activity
METMAVNDLPERVPALSSRNQELFTTFFGKSLAIVFAMTDQRIEGLKRSLQADPANAQLQLELLNTQARVEGSAVCLAVLKDRLLWNQSSEAVQDLAIKEVQRRLGDAYSIQRIRASSSRSFWPWTRSKQKTRDKAKSPTNDSKESKSDLARIYSCGGQSHRIASFKHNASGLILNLIPGGTFIMGDDYSTKEIDEVEGYREDQERPAHEARIAPMLIGRYAVSASIWAKVERGRYLWMRQAHSPVDRVSWYDCQAWLQKAGDGLRLPSEWEYACRSGTTTQYFWGEEQPEHDDSEKIPFYEDSNAFGLMHMGNCFSEWCQDDWIGDYRDGPYDSQPRSTQGPDRMYVIPQRRPHIIDATTRSTQGPDRMCVIRGGQNYFFIYFTRSAHRWGWTASGSGNFMGLRVARTL